MAGLQKAQASNQSMFLLSSCSNCRIYGLPLCFTVLNYLKLTSYVMSRISYMQIAGFPCILRLLRPLKYHIYLQSHQVKRIPSGTSMNRLFQYRTHYYCKIEPTSRFKGTANGFNAHKINLILIFDITS